MSPHWKPSRPFSNPNLHLQPKPFETGLFVLFPPSLRVGLTRHTVKSKFSQGEPLGSSRDVPVRLRQRRSSGGEGAVGGGGGVWLQNPEGTRGAARREPKPTAERRRPPARSPGPAGSTLLLPPPDTGPAVPQTPRRRLGRTGGLKMARAATAASAPSPRQRGTRPRPPAGPANRRPPRPAPARRPSRRGAGQGDVRRLG